MAQVFAGKRQRAIGILREVKGKWERRVPLIPSDVAKLVKQERVRVLVQPSSHRIYKDAEYRAAGAELVEDLSPANTIFGVKEFPKESLIPNKSYMIFSHVIKAQPYNMPFLDETLKQNVRLFDYETIRTPVTADGKGGNRLVAFGKFAGFAGMIDAFRGIGERLLSLGYSSPFMGIGSSYMYPDLPTAKAAVRKAGEEIREFGLPPEIAPMRFVFTGTGNVAQGAREIFELLPHKYVSAKELATLPHDPHVVYGCVVQAEDMVERIDASRPFNKAEYYAQPHLYRPVFHEKIAPHLNVLVNCMYWNATFPRLLSIPQMRAIERTYDANPRLRKFLAVADITCDIGGGVEFLKRSCTIDNPFFMYNPLTDEVTQPIEGRGVLMLGVDNLPAEFPKDASGHFSQALTPFVPPLAESDHSKPFTEAHSYLPPEIYNSCIVADGKLTPPFEYIAHMRTAQTQSATAPQHSQQTGQPAPTKPVQSDLSLDVMLEGHLFDTGFINQALDIFENEGEDFEVVQWVLSPNRAERANNLSRAVIHVQFATEAKKAALFQRIQTLAARMPSAQAKLVPLHFCDATKTYSHIDGSKVSFKAPVQTRASTQRGSEARSGSGHSMSTDLNRKLANSASDAAKKRKILVLGSGFVVGPFVEYLHRRPENQITVASAAAQEAAKLVAPFQADSSSNEVQRVEAVELNVSDADRLRTLIEQHDIVVSLLPATFHPQVARLAIEAKKDMVTASYVSPAMKQLDEAAKQAGITILNEMGLDPGLDHLACAQIIDEAHAKGSKVLGFQSLCGGLPAPEASSNPFAYKFSWSPLGMLLATQNTAIFREAGKQVEIPSSRLLTSAKPLELNSAYSLEYYANRDSLSYIDVYGIPEVQSMFRGTIRYTGTARLLHGYAKVGLLDRTPIKSMPKDLTWRTLFAQMMNCAAKDLKEVVSAKLTATGDFDARDVKRVVSSMEWLGLFSSSESLLRAGATFDATHAYTPMELLCAILMEKLQYAPGERDMVIMYHEFLLAHKDGTRSIKRSSLISYGGDDGITNTNPLIALTPGGGGRKGYSAMSRTVGIPAAIGTQMILDGKLHTTGVLIPTQRDIYEPVLRELKENEGIEFVEEETKIE